MAAAVGARGEADGTRQGEKCFKSSSPGVIGTVLKGMSFRMDVSVCEPSFRAGEGESTN